MKKYSVRPATPRDLDAVYALIAAQNNNDYGEAMLTVEDLQRSWQTVHLETNTCMAYALGEFHRRDIRRAKLSVDLKSLTNAPRLYESVGMKTIQQYRIYRKNLQV